MKLIIASKCLTSPASCMSAKIGRYIFLGFPLTALISLTEICMYILLQNSKIHTQNVGFLVRTYIFLFISLLQNPASVVCSRFKSADLGFIVKEIITGSVSLTILGFGLV